MKVGKVDIGGGAPLDGSPEKFNRIIVRRIAGQARHRKALDVLGKKVTNSLSGVVFGPVLNQEERLTGLVEDSVQEGDVAGGIELAFDPLEKQTSAEALQQAKDVVGAALAAGGDGGLLTDRRP